MLAATSIYAGLLALLYVYLSARVIGQRRNARISLGTGEDPELLRRTRVHANFAEYVPLALILIACCESLAAPTPLLHGLGLGLLIGRMAHAYGVSKSPQVMQMRLVGMVLTFTVLVAGAITCLLRGLGLVA